MGNSKMQRELFFPSSVSELFDAWNRAPEAALMAGGTSLLMRQSGEKINLEKTIISLEKMEELCRLSRTERYIEIGALVTVDRILSLGKIIPPSISAVLEECGSLPLRTLLTIGGLTASAHPPLMAAMAALEARFEIRTPPPAQAKWIPASRMISEILPKIAEDGKILITRIHVPLEEWEYSRQAAFSFPSDNTAAGAVTLLGRIQKDLLTDMRVAYAGKGPLMLRDRDIEIFLAGKKLPLQEKDAASWLDMWKAKLETHEKAPPPPFIKKRFLAFLKDAVEDISG